MRFSIVMPTFNRPAFVVEAVNAILSQSFTDFELIIKDGGDSIFHLLPKDPRIVYIHGKDKGITDAMNQAMKISKGEIINWSNDDDQMSPGILEMVDKQISDHKWLYGRIIMDNGIQKLLYGEPWNFEQLKHGNFVPQPSVFWKREAMEEVGFMDETQDLVSDYEYWLRLGSRFEPKFIEEPMANYRIHKDQITSRIPHQQLAQAAIVRQKYL